MSGVATTVGGGADITLSASPLALTDADIVVPAGFDTSVDYTLTTTLGGQAFTVTTTGGSVNHTTGPFVQSSASGTVSGATASGRLIAGNYQSTITVVVSPT